MICTLTRINSFFSSDETIALIFHMLLPRYLISFVVLFQISLPLLSHAAEEVESVSTESPALLFYGNSMIERLLEYGGMEARLQIATSGKGLKIRSLAWTGDEVGNRLRLEGYPKHMKNLIKQWPSNVLVLGYGMNEAFHGAEGLPQFKRDYQSHIQQLAKTHPKAKFVLLSPTAAQHPVSDLNENLKLYRNAISKLAQKNQAYFIDLFTPTLNSSSRLTENGIHLNDLGNKQIGSIIAQELLGYLGVKNSKPASENHIHEVRQAASAKHNRVAEVVRPKNAVVYFGVRARPYEYAGEIPRYHKMIELTEEIVHRMAAEPKLKFANLERPSLDPMPPGKGHDDGKRTGIIKPPTDAMAEFTVADGYAINLFASEEQFPELRNPVQMAFDAKGRLWVVTMPSFPHTVPGLSPEDKLIILEDTDRDGKADKCTTFAENLDALDGIAFHHQGVIVSEQPRLLLMRDEDGDDRADWQHELLRGIDVTDSHHGGMIATDPHGDILFCDGVFHRSQLETPFGVHRGIDSTTYRLDPATGRINTEWQHTTPNPWNITFDRWGNTFQMYGDGDVYDGTSLIWTPLGGYMPYAYARITSYGKGCGTSSISSTNFPDEYQNGIASASLLGRYAVNLTILNTDRGMFKQKSYQTILSSPNAAFRPADLEFGMDGALYISDFSSPIIGHAQHPMRDPHWDHDYGRIWRVVHTGKPIVKEWPKIEGATLNDLCKLLVHPQNLIRHHTRIELRKHGKKAISAIDQWIKAFDPKADNFEQAMLESIFVCEGLGQARSDLIEQLAKSKSYLFRGAAVRTLRLQADRISNTKEMLTTFAKDAHPRVLMEVINAVAHLRPHMPEVESSITGINTKNPDVKNSLAYLDLGTEPLKGSSVPVLEVSKSSQLTQWIGYEDKNKTNPVEYQIGKSKLPGTGFFRSFIYSDKAQSATIGVNHKNLEVYLNGILKFSQNSLWSGDQQINVELRSGLNVFEFVFLKGRRAARFMPAVYVYDPLGNPLPDAQYLTNLDQLRKADKEHQQEMAKAGNILRVQAAPELQFAPKRLQVQAGTKVTLIFSNPDVMLHNWLLGTPGSAQEIGELADKMASTADGFQKGYIPESDKILVSSKLLSPNESQEIEFEAPDQPGDYPYLCTFPGHWRMMQGILTVKAAP